MCTYKLCFTFKDYTATFLKLYKTNQFKKNMDPQFLKKINENSWQTCFSINLR